jgi:SAM-dependent methyltransferase
VDAESFAALLTPVGRAAVDAAVVALDAGADSIGLSTRLRRDFQLSPEICAAALTQAALRRRGREKFGSDADRLWFTPDGLEQSTRSVLAAHRAARFGRWSATLGRPARIADLCCGIGADLIALATAGADVVGVERDPLTAEVARANTGDGATSVVCADAETFDLDGFDAAFIDPARRRDSRRTFDVRAYSPSWDFVAGLLNRLPSAAKLAPGIPHELAPSGVEIEWVSHLGALKEAVLWSPALREGDVSRRATLLPAGVTLTSSESADVTGTPVGAPARYLYQPDPAVVRSHLVATLARDLGAVLLDETTAYLTSDALVSSPFARAFEVTDALPFSLKRLRELLRNRSIGAVTIMKRGSAVDVEQLRRDLRLRGDRHAVVVLALVAGRHEMLIAQPAPSPIPPATH